MIQAVPFFSIVIPLYNKEKYVRRSLDSVITQTFDDFEIIVVDDGSTDSSAKLVNSYGDPRIRLIRQTNAGVSAARNRGISEAKGQWIAFLDADDEYRPNFLRQLEICSKRFTTAGAIYTRTAYLRGNTEVRMPSPRINAPKLLDDYLRFVVFQNGPEIHTSSIAVKRSVFCDTGLFPIGIKVGEDSDMWLRVAYSTGIVYVPEILSVFHIDSGDSNWERHWDQPAFWVNTYQSWLGMGRIPERFRRSAASYYQKYLLDKSLGHAIRGNPAQARKILWNEVVWPVAPKFLGFKVLLYSYLPLWLFRFQRKITSRLA